MGEAKSVKIGSLKLDGLGLSCLLCILTYLFLKRVPELISKMRGVKPKHDTVIVEEVVIGEQKVAVGH